MDIGQMDRVDAKSYMASFEERFGTFNKNKHQLLGYSLFVVPCLLGRLFLLIVQFHRVNHLDRILHVHVYEREISFKIAEKYYRSERDK